MATKAPLELPRPSDARRRPDGDVLARTRVEAYVRGPVITIPAAMRIGSILSVLERNEISAAPVVATDGAAVGVVSRSDLLRAASAGYQSAALRGYDFDAAITAAAALMHRGVITVPRGASIAEAARSMAKHRVHRAFVADERGRPVGVLGTREIMRAIADAGLTSRIDSLTSRRPYTVPCEMSVALAVGRLTTVKAQGLVVVDADAWPAGLFTQREALLARALHPSAVVEDAMSHALLCLNANTPLHRAALHAAHTRARRVLVVDDRKLVGVLTGLDFARLARDPA